MDPAPLSRESPSYDARRLLVERVTGSAPFQRSRRLRDFLVFVCDRALADPESTADEHEIGTRVFGRPPDFHAGEDTLVRVHASRLRKRLEEYFATEGASEPVVIEIPKHSYMPVFRRREVDSAAKVEGSKGGKRRQGFAGAVAALVLILVACSTCLYLDNRGLRRRLGGGEPRPTVDNLWKQMFGNGRPVYLVLADSNLVMLEYVLRRQLSPLEYRQKQFRVPQRMHCDPDAAQVVRDLMSRQYTSLADASLTRHLSLLNAVHAVPTFVISAQDADPEDFKSSNAVLAGSRRSNPWLELFEDRLNFQSRFDERRRVAYFENMEPRPGEERTYTAKHDVRGYCRVAYLSNLGQTGSVLILSGTELASTEAAVDFVTSERWLRLVRSMLKVGGRSRFPHFEVLLQTHLVSFASPKFELVAVRTSVAP